MKFVFTNILGSFVVDESKIVSQKEDLKGLKQLPEDKISQALLLFKDKKYYSAFRDKNLALTKKAIKESVTEDQFIIQAIANINELDRAANMLSKRVREWYSLYFPELSKKITDHENFVHTVCDKSKKELTAEFKSVMGADLEKKDVDEILLLANQVKELYNLRRKHEDYLEIVMKKYCPNILELAGATIGAKLLELGKGLRHLAMLPASTIQLLGAEKALFRHIKTGARSPKYGVLLQHPFVQKSKKSIQGKAARQLADKLSLCARLDYFKGDFKAKEFRRELEAKL
jgi:nucleolar protein 56